MFVEFLLLHFLVQSSTAVIYKLNDVDYALMSPLFHLDPYEACFEDPEGLYCSPELALVSDEPSPLLTMIQEYSAHATKHYNHTLLRHGICITRTCKKFYEVSEGDLRLTIEACVNESLYDKYKLKARVSDGFECTKAEEKRAIDYLDLTVAGICIAILCANIIGSICDYFFGNGKDDGGLRYLYCFSISRNWKKLVAPPAENREPRLQALKGLHGIRVLTTCLVLGAHSLLINIVFTANPEYMEDLYATRPFHILLNGTMIMQTFLIISSFLLVYNWLIYAEKHEPSWKILPKQFLMRWLRLTPSYAVVLALTATWFGRFSSGPYWKKIIYKEMMDCRNDWWKNLLYINNYFDNSECMVQTWYLAADTQLYYMAAIVIVMCRTLRSRKIVLSLLFVIGLIIPAVHTYLLNLDGVFIISPECIFSIFLDSPVFNHVYKRGHTNLTGYVIGMTMGYMIYDWQKTGGDPKRFQKYRYLYWSLFLMGCLCCYSGTIFYADAPPPSTFVNLLFAAFMKPIFGIITGSVIVGVVMQFEDLYRSILEWHAWTIPSRLSFSAYLVHIFFVRSYMAMRTTPARMCFSEIPILAATILSTSFTAAFFFWMLVECPFANLIRETLIQPDTQAKEGSKDKDEGATKKAVVKAMDKTPTNKEEVVDKSPTKKENIVDKSPTKQKVAKIVDKITNKNGTKKR